MRHRQVQDLALFGAAGKGRIDSLYPDFHGPADEVEALIANQRTRQETGLHQYLKAVADAQHQTTVQGKLFNCLDHRRELGDGAATQVVAVGKATRKDDGVNIAQRWAIVPNELRSLMKVVRYGVPSVVIAVATRENDNANFHELLDYRTRRVVTP